MTKKAQEYVLFGIIFVVVFFMAYYADRNRHALERSILNVIDYRYSTLNIEPTRYPTPLPDSSIAQAELEATPTPTPTTPLPTIAPTVATQPPEGNGEWGVAEKVDDVTYKIKVGNDPAMATPSEVVAALNVYRSVNGRGSLTWDDKLGNYAQTRANTFQSLGNTDKHAGFNDYLENGNGFQDLGFYRVGENSYWGGKLTGTHLIEWVFSQSPGHNENQLSDQWSHVGVGVTDSSVNLIFAGDRM